MKISNWVLVNMMNEFKRYSKLKLPQKISYAITRNLMWISKEYEIYETQLKKIFEEYSEHMIKDEDGNIKVNQNGIPIVDDIVSDEFGEQIADLLNITIEVDMYHIEPDIFDYDDKGIYSPMSAEDILTLQSILCKSDYPSESDSSV